MRSRFHRRKAAHQTKGMNVGFTLVELMVVMVLIGVMTAMIVPEMKGTFEDALLRSTGRQLMSVCNLAYSQAVSAHQLHRVHLDPKSGRYQIERPARQNEEGARFVVVRNVPGAEGKLDERIRIEVRAPEDEPTAKESEPAAPELPRAFSSTDDLDTIAFYPDGTAVSREILLRDREGFRLLLRINPTTARVRVEDLGRE